MSLVGKTIWKQKKWYYLDDGTYGCFYSEFLKLKHHDIFAPYSKGESQLCCLTGPTCDGTDIIWDEILMPELNYGDILVIKDVVSYSWTLATVFNSIPVPKVVSFQFSD